VSDISNITNSLTSSLLSSLLSGSSTTDTQAADSNSIASDIVSLLGSSSSTTDGSLYSILSGNQGSDSTDPMYNILLSAESASILQANPSLVQDILTANETSAGNNTSSGSTSAQTTSTQDLIQELENMNFLSMSPDSLTSLLKGSTASQASPDATSGSLVNQKA